MHKAHGCIRTTHTIPLHRETKFRASSGSTSLLATGQQTSITLTTCPLGKQAGTGTHGHPGQYLQERACSYLCLIQTPRLFLLIQACRSELRCLGKKSSALSNSALPRGQQTSPGAPSACWIRGLNLHGFPWNMAGFFLRVPIPGHRQLTNCPSVLPLDAPAFEKKMSS